MSHKLEQHLEHTLETIISELRSQPSVEFLDILNVMKYEMVFVLFLPDYWNLGLIINCLCVG